MHKHCGSIYRNLTKSSSAKISSSFAFIIFARRGHKMSATFGNFGEILHKIKLTIEKIPICLKLRQDDTTKQYLIKIRDRARRGDKKIPHLETLLNTIASYNAELESELGEIFARIDKILPWLAGDKRDELIKIKYDFAHYDEVLANMRVSINDMLENPDLLMASPTAIYANPKKAKEFMGENALKKLKKRKDDSVNIYQDSSYAPRFLNDIISIKKMTESVNYARKIDEFEKIAQNAAVLAGDESEFGGTNVAVLPDIVRRRKIVRQNERAVVPTTSKTPLVVAGVIVGISALASVVSYFLIPSIFVWALVIGILASAISLGVGIHMYRTCRPKIVRDIPMDGTAPDRQLEAAPKKEESLIPTPVEKAAKLGAKIKHAVKRK
jgi:hypothetical protein